MAYRDPIKKAKHYEDYQKPYMKKWVSDNKNDWNEYQKNYKVRKRFEVVKNIIEDVKELNISNEGSMVFNAAVIFFYINQTRIIKPWAISYRTGILAKDVKFIQKNWIKSKLCDNKGVFYLEETKNDLEAIIQLTLICLVGSGDLYCSHAKKN